MLRFYKKIRKIIAISIFLFLCLYQYLLAASINIEANKTELSTDEYVNITFSVNGNIDDDKISIAGLENFDIIGRSFSNNIVIVNGDRKVLQEQIFNLKPKRDGVFEIYIIAKSNKEVVKSDKILFKVKKTYLQNVKDNLLNSSFENNEDKSGIEENNQKQEDLLNIESGHENKKPVISKKELLLVPQDNINSTKEFPRIRHISPFNSIFWFQFLVIIIAIIVIFFSIYYSINSKDKNKNK